MSFGKKLLTQEDLLRRFNVKSLRQVQRIRKEFGLEPFDFRGPQLLFTPEAVEAVKNRRRLARIVRASSREHLITVEEAKRLAGRAK